MNKKINIIEKDKKICSLINNILDKETYNINSFVYSKEKDLEKILDNKPDLLIVNSTFKNTIINETTKKGTNTGIIFIEHEIKNKTQNDKYENINMPLKKEELINKIKTTIQINELKKIYDKNINSLNNEIEDYKDKNTDLNIYQKHLEDTISQLTIHLTEANNQLQLEHKLINQINEALIFIDIDGYIEIWNTGAEKLFGYKKEEIIGKHIKILFRDTNKQIIHNKIINPVLAKSSYKIDTLLKTKQNKDIYGHLSLSIFKERSIKNIIIHFVDGSKKIQIEESLKRSELNLSLISRLSKDAIISVNNTGKILFWNGSAENIFNYKKEEIINYSIEKLIPPKSRKIYLGRLKQILKSKESYIIGKNIQAQAMKKDGSIFPIELAFCSYNIADNKFFTAIVKEINEPHKYKNIFSALSRFAPNVKEDNPFPISEVRFEDSKTIEEQSNKLLAYLDALGMFFTIAYHKKNKEHIKISFISKELLKTLGDYEKKDIKTIKDILAKPFKNTLSRINQKSFGVVSKINFITKDKKEKTLLCKLTPIYNSSKEIIEILVSVQKHKDSNYHKVHYKKQRELLNTKEQLLTFMWENVKTSLITVNPGNLTIKRLNPYAENLLKTYPSIIQGKHPELNKVQKSKKTMSITQRLHNAKENKEDFKIKIQPILDKENSVHIIAVSINKENVEQEDNENQTAIYSSVKENSILKEKYNALLFNATSFIFITDKSGTITESYVNKTLNNKKIIGKNILAIQKNKDINLKIKELLEQRKQFKLYEEPVRKITLKEDMAYVNIIGVPLNNFGAMFIYEDITYNKVIEKLTRSSKEKYQSIIDAVKETIIIINEKEKIIFSNHRINTLLGYKLSEAVGKKLSDIIELKENSINTLIKTNKENVELTGIKKNNRKIPIEASIASFKDYNENKYTIVMRNISERKEQKENKQTLNNHTQKHIKSITEEINKINSTLSKIKTPSKTLENSLNKSKEKLNKITGKLNKLL